MLNERGIMVAAPTAAASHTRFDSYRCRQKPYTCPKSVTLNRDWKQVEAWLLFSRSDYFVFKTVAEPQGSRLSSW